ncbi:MAG: GNAT family N-acetyltransferase [Chloroflexota bacterium]
MLQGTLVDLRAVEPSDYQLLWRWLNDPAVTVFWGVPGNTVSLPEVARREEEQAGRSNSRKYIIQTKNATPIGQIDYYDLDWQARSAWTSIMIGDPEYWGGGFGTDAMRTLVGYLFHQLDLHRVSLTVHASNTRAQRSYEKSGFVKEGTLRQWQFFDDHWVDGILMAVLRDDFDRAATSARSEPSADQDS